MTWIINVSNRLTFETLGIIYKKKKVTLRKKKFSNYSRSPRRSSWSLPQPRPRFFQLYSRRCTKILRGSWRLPGLSLKLRQEKNNERRWYVIRRWNLMGGWSTKNVRRKRKKREKRRRKKRDCPPALFQRKREETWIRRSNLSRGNPAVYHRCSTKIKHPRRVGDVRALVEDRWLIWGI